MNRKEFFRSLTPADHLAIFVFFFSSFIPDWWLRKALFLTGLVMMLLAYAVRSFPRTGKIRFSFDAADITAFLFAGVLIVSFLFSRFPAYSVALPLQEEGLITHLTYLLAFVVLRRVFCPRRFHFYLFLAAMLPVVILEVLTCFGILPQGETEAAVTTYSNFNMLTQILVIAFAVNFLLSLKKSGSAFSLSHGITSFILLLGIILARSDAGLLCLLFFFLLFPIVVKIDTLALRRITESAAALAAAFGVTALLKAAMPGWITLMEDNLLLTAALGTPLPVSFGAAVLLVLAAEVFFSKKERDHTVLCRILSGAVCVLGVTLFLVIGTGTDRHFYSLASDWLIGRGAILKLGFTAYFRELSVFEKLFGTGYNSFQSYFLTYLPSYIPGDFYTRYLLPHNFILQTLFETGLFGFAGYTAIFAGSLYRGLKQRDETAHISFFAVTVYLVSMLFYVPSPEITIPVLFFLAALSPKKRQRLQEN